MIWRAPSNLVSQDTCFGQSFLDKNHFDFGTANSVDTKLYSGVLELLFCTVNLIVKLVSGIINEIYDLVWANRALCEFFKHALTNYCPGLSCEHCCVGRTDNHFACLDVSHWDQGISSRLGAWLPCCSLNNHVVTKSWAPETSDPRRQILVILTSP